MSAKMSDHEFINNIIIPAELGLIGKDILSIIYDLEGNVVIASNKLAQLWGYQEYWCMLGKKLVELYQGTEDGVFVEELEAIRKAVIEEEKICTYLTFIAQPHGLTKKLNYHYPIFNPDGKVVATRVVAERANIFNHALRISQWFKPTEDNLSSSLPPVDKEEVRLTPREKEILYLLTMGLSQTDAASYLGITRGTLSKVLGTKICPQFNVAGINTKALIKAVLDSNYFTAIPKSLLKPKITVIDNDFEAFLDC